MVVAVMTPGISIPAARRAVHCGTDLASAVGNVLGYQVRDMKGSKQMWVPLV